VSNYFCCHVLPERLFWCWYDAIRYDTVRVFNTQWNWRVVIILAAIAKFLLTIRWDKHNLWTKYSTWGCAFYVFIVLFILIFFSFAVWFFGAWPSGVWRKIDGTACEKLVFLPAGLHAAQLAVIAAQWSKMGFSLAGPAHCPDKLELAHGAVPKCHVYLSGQKCENTGPKTVKFWNFAHKYAPQGRLVCTLFTKFSAFVHVYR